MSGGAKVDASATDRPQYIRISDVLRDRIATGAYAVGDLLPTEGDLCEEFSTSRHTVREALRRLTQAGLIERRQGSGSRVLATEPHMSYVHAMRSLDQLFQYASDTRFVIHDTRTAQPDPALFPEVSRGASDWLILEGTRMEQADDTPICQSTVLVAAKFADVSKDLTAQTGAIYRKLEDRFGVEVAEVVQDITVVEMPVSAARALGCAPGEVAVKVRRRYQDKDGTVMIASVNHHPADRFSYTMQLKREAAKGPFS